MSLSSAIESCDFMKFKDSFGEGIHEDEAIDLQNKLSLRFSTILKKALCSEAATDSNFQMNVTGKLNSLKNILRLLVSNNKGTHPLDKFTLPDKETTFVFNSVFNAVTKNPSNIVKLKELIKEHAAGTRTESTRNSLRSNRNF
jgi:hypothetical protein